MAKLSNINNLFSVDSTGAIEFSTQVGATGYVLESRGAGNAPVWTDRDTGNVTGSGTLNKVVRWTATGSTVGDGPITFATNDSTFAGTVTAPKFVGSGTAAVFELIQSTTGAATYYVMDNTVETGGKKYRFGYTGGSSDKGSFTIYNETDSLLPLLISGANSTFAGTISAVGASTFTLNDGIFIKAVNGTNNVAATNVWGYGLYEGTSKLGEISLVRDGSNSQMYIGTTGANQVLRIGSANKVTALTIDASQNATFAGNVGIGISPSASFSGVDVLQLGKGMTLMGNANDDRATMGANLYLDAGTAFRYVMDGYAGRFSIEDGQMIWGVSAIGNAGDIATVNTKMTLLNNGNVGIGTDSPDNKLQVVAGNAQIQAWFGETSYTDSAIRIGGANGAGGRLFVQYVGDNSYIDCYGGHGSTERYRDLSLIARNLIFKTASAASPSEAMRIDSSGNVGIGNEGTNIVVTGKGLGIQNIGQDTTASMRLTGANATGNPGVATYTELKHYGEHLRFGINHNGGTDVITINSSKNVGIGTTSPDVKLHIVGDGDRLEISSDDYDLIKMGAYGDSGADLDNGFLNLSLDGSEKIRLLANGTSYFNGGNVGIGTTNPSAPLDIGASGSVNNIGVAIFNENSTTAYSSGGFNSRPTHTLYGINTANTYVGTRFTHAGNTEFFHGIVKGAANGEATYVFQGYNGSAYQQFGAIDMYSTGAGSLVMSGDVVAYSDKKLKKNIKTLDGSKVYKMRGVSFDRIDTGKKSSGVIAQEMQEIAPELISESNETLGVSYGNLTGYLIEAIKELKAEIEELKSNKCNCNK
jgi:hypothetical protein